MIDKDDPIIVLQALKKPIMLYVTIENTRYQLMIFLTLHFTYINQ